MIHVNKFLKGKTKCRINVSSEHSLSFPRVSFIMLCKREKELIYFVVWKWIKNIYGKVTHSKICRERIQTKNKYFLGFLCQKSNDNVQCYLPIRVWGGAWPAACLVRSSDEGCVSFFRQWGCRDPTWVGLQMKGGVDPQKGWSMIGEEVSQG